MAIKKKKTSSTRRSSKRVVPSKVKGRSIAKRSTVKSKGKKSSVLLHDDREKKTSRAKKPVPKSVKPKANKGKIGVKNKAARKPAQAVKKTTVQKLKKTSAKSQAKKGSKSKTTKAQPASKKAVTASPKKQLNPPPFVRPAKQKEYQYYNEIYRIGQGYDDQIIKGKLNEGTIPARGRAFGRDKDKSKTREAQAEWEEEDEEVEFRPEVTPRKGDAAQEDDDDEEAWQEDAYEASNEPDKEEDDYESTPKTRKKR